MNYAGFLERTNACTLVTVEDPEQKMIFPWTGAAIRWWQANKKGKGKGGNKSWQTYWSDQTKPQILGYNLDLSINLLCR